MKSSAWEEEEEEEKEGGAIHGLPFIHFLIYLRLLYNNEWVAKLCDGACLGAVMLLLWSSDEWPPSLPLRKPLNIQINAYKIFKCVYRLRAFCSSSSSSFSSLTLLSAATCKRRRLSPPTRSYSTARPMRYGLPHFSHPNLRRCRRRRHH